MNLKRLFMSDEQGKDGFKFNATLDIGHVITFLLLLGSLAVAWRGVGERAVATDARIAAVEKESRSNQASIEKVTETLRVIGENQVRLAEKLDQQEKRFSDDHQRIRDLERIK